MMSLFDDLKTGLLAGSKPVLASIIVVLVTVIALTGGWERFGWDANSIPDPNEGVPTVIKMALSALGTSPYDLIYLLVCGTRMTDIKSRIPHPLAEEPHHHPGVIRRVPSARCPWTLARRSSPSHSPLSRRQPCVFAYWLLLIVCVPSPSPFPGCARFSIKLRNILPKSQARPRGLNFRERSYHARYDWAALWCPGAVDWDYKKTIMAVLGEQDRVYDLSFECPDGLLEHQVQITSSVGEHR